MPEVADIMQTSEKVLGKCKEPEDSDSEVVQKPAKMHAREDNTEEDNHKGSKRRNSKASRTSTSTKVATKSIKVKTEPEAKQKGRSTGSRNFSIPEIHRLLRSINLRLPIGGKGWEVVAADSV
jgi:hypothetical protein